MNAMERFRRECAVFFDALGTGAQEPLVFGDGPCDGPVLMLIGEAPGEQEALEGRPFVGKAGKNLDGFLKAVGLRRGEIYVTNVVKLRPTRQSAAGRVVNRPPSREEKVSRFSIFSVHSSPPPVGGDSTPIVSPRSGPVKPNFPSCPGNRPFLPDIPA